MFHHLLSMVKAAYWTNKMKLKGIQSNYKSLKTTRVGVQCVKRTINFVGDHATGNLRSILS